MLVKSEPTVAVGLPVGKVPEKPPLSGLPAMSVTGVAPVPLMTTSYWSLGSGAAMANVTRSDPVASFR